MGTHLHSLYRNNPGGSNSSMSQAWQLCSFLTALPFFFMPHCLVHPLSPALFSPDNPCLSSCCLAPISILHCHTLHHSSPLFPLLTLLSLLSEALETRCWLFYTMAPVFTLLFTCLQTALTTFSEAALDTKTSHSQRILCSSIHCAYLSICVGFVTIECKLASNP